MNIGEEGSPRIVEHPAVPDTIPTEQPAPASEPGPAPATEPAPASDPVPLAPANS